MVMKARDLFRSINFAKRKGKKEQKIKKKKENDEKKSVFIS